MAPPLAGSRVLIVDAEESSRVMLAGLVVRAGVDAIAFAGDGEEGLRKVLRFRPDLVLLDVRMPRMDGLEMCRRLRRDLGEATLPVLFQTPADGDADPAHCFEAGGSDVIAKPIRPGECIARVRHHLEKRALFEELSSFRRRVEAELTQARTLQLSLVPERRHLEAAGARYGLAIESHFETSSELGGDLWTLRPLDDTRIAVMIADFTGHGVTAALNTVRLHTLIDRIPLDAGDPAGWMMALNAALKATLPVGQFATAFLGIIDVAAGTLTGVGAGSPNPALWLPDGSVRLLESSGLLLGVSRKASYVSRTVALPPGAALFLYSDALIECGGPAGIGQQAVPLLVGAAMAGAPGRPLHHVLDRVFGGRPRPLADDLTAVWITRL
ncbi:PP2C family protein-serine/threonine phosphatase [Azospirillum halopraeferens]|uniref:PP2C family protein-serine/threonine phosphatase n=1 Tax=Azospirillum halopraeferens TaxID=34010 RepID=UPI00041E6A91|nr:fused response regulator/phosphatase [Azospirillum halopraeferens]